MEKAGEGVGVGVSNGVGMQTSMPSNVVEIRPGVLNTESTESNNVEIEQGKEVETEVLDRVEDKVDEAENVIFAEDLFEVAKNEGEDAAFEMMAADEDFEPQENVDHEEDEGSEETEHAQKTEEKVQEGMNERVSALEARVDNLIQENKHLKERVEKAEHVQMGAVAGAYELAALMKQLIEENEELKKKNKSFLEVLMRIMANLLALMVVDEDRARKQEEESVEKAAA